MHHNLHPIPQRMAAALLCISAAATGQAQDTSSQDAIATVLNQFVISIRDREPDALKAILHDSLTVVELSSTDSHVTVLYPDDAVQLIPPADNDDWERTSISQFSIDLSPTHPHAATASFTLTFPLSERQLTMLREMPEEARENLSEAQQERMKTLLEEKQRVASMLALLAKKEGRWKIVSLTFPN